MSNITAFPGAASAAEPDERVIGVIKELLEKAESGEIRSIAATCTMDDNSRLTAFATKGIDCMVLLGQLHMLEHEYMRREGLHED
jgi:hypothetical protein